MFHLHSVSSYDWTPIFIKAESFSLVNYKYEHINIIRKQLPTVISQGMTVYKAQSATFDRVAITPTFKGHQMKRSEFYTAASRVTKLQI